MHGARSDRQRVVVQRYPPPKIIVAGRASPSAVIGNAAPSAHGAACGELGPSERPFPSSGESAWGRCHRSTRGGAHLPRRTRSDFSLRDSRGEDELVRDYTLAASEGLWGDDAWLRGPLSAVQPVAWNGWLGWRLLRTVLASTGPRVTHSVASRSAAGARRAARGARGAWAEIV